MGKAVCKLCKSQMAKLFLKGERCLSEKCPLEKASKAARNKRLRTRRPAKMSEYGLQLREKQKAKRMAGMREKQFNLYYQKASRKKGQTGELLLQMLECRLDNIVYQLSMASSKAQARQLVTHRNVRVNNIVVNKPSCQVKVGDEISLSKKAANSKFVKNSVEKAKKHGEIPGFLQFDPEKIVGTMLVMPAREDISIPVEEQLIVELYSK